MPRHAALNRRSMVLILSCGALWGACGKKEPDMTVGQTLDATVAKARTEAKDLEASKIDVEVAKN
jgi:hypothetical protein